MYIHVYILTFGVGFLSERFIIDSWARKEEQETKCTYVYNGLLFKSTHYPHLNGGSGDSG